MTVIIKYIPSISDENQGVAAKFDGRHVSYNGEYYSNKATSREYTPGDGFGVLDFDEDTISLKGTISKGTETPLGIVTGVRVRVVSQEGGWDSWGFTAHIPEIRIDDGEWDTYYGLIPTSVKEEIGLFRKERAIEYIQATVRQRLENGFKSSKEEIEAFCNRSWADGLLSAREALAIGLAERKNQLEI